MEGENHFHYLAITNLDRLLNVYRNGIQIKRKWCHICLHGFKSENSFQKHIELCSINTESTTLFVMPEEKELKFQDWSKTVSPHFIIYADFESILVPDERYSQKHLPASAGLLLIGSSGEQKYFEFSGNDCIIQFIQCLDELSKNVVLPWYKNNSKHPMKPLTVEQLHSFQESKKC